MNKISQTHQGKKGRQLKPIQLEIKKKKGEGTVDTTEDHKRVYKQLHANKMETRQKWTNS